MLCLYRVVGEGLSTVFFSNTEYLVGRMRSPFEAANFLSPPPPSLTACPPFLLLPKELLKSVVMREIGDDTWPHSWERGRVSTYDSSSKRRKGANLKEEGLGDSRKLKVSLHVLRLGGRISKQYECICLYVYVYTAMLTPLVFLSAS